MLSTKAKNLIPARLQFDGVGVPHFNPFLEKSSLLFALCNILRFRCVRVHFLIFTFAVANTSLTSASHFFMQTFINNAQ
jgi:hypothetical protein